MSVAKERATDTLDALRLTALESRDVLFQKWVGVMATDADDGACCLTFAWDSDNDGEYDDSTRGNPEDVQLSAGFGVRVTDPAGATTTVRRTLTPIVPVADRAFPSKPGAWLRVAPRRPALATLLRRGITVDVSCTQPKCRTRLVVKVDAKTARKLGLRSRIVGTRTVSGSRQARVQLTPKAKLITNASYLQFADTSSMEEVLQDRQIRRGRPTNGQAGVASQAGAVGG